jgi:putative copper resistance protein D
MEILSDTHLLSMSLVRGLLLIGVILLVGGLGFHRFLFEPALSSFPTERASSLRAKGEAFTRRLAWAALLLLFVVNLVALVHEGMMMSGKPLPRVFPLLPTVLMRTHWGAVWIVRTVLLAVLLPVVQIAFSSSLPLLLSVGLALTVSLVSHAVDAGDLSIPVAADAVHLVFVSLWIGGLVPLRFLSRRACESLDPDRQRLFLIEILRRFSRLALLAVILIYATGIYTAWFHLPNLSVLGTSAYGQILLAKVFLASGTVGMGGISRFYILPRLKRAGSKERILRMFWAALAVELLVALLTLAAASLLTQATPPHKG